MGQRTFFSLNWPDLARQWLPIIDHPYDKATSEFLVTAPAQYQVAANGLLQEGTGPGRWAPVDALETGRADRIMAERGGGGAVLRAVFR